MSIFLHGERQPQKAQRDLHLFKKKTVDSNVKSSEDFAYNQYHK